MEKRLYRVRKGRMLAGVANGLAEYLDMDPTVMRLIIVLVTLAYLPIGLIGYIIAAIVIPEKLESEAGDAGSNDGAGGAGENDGKEVQTQANGQPIHTGRRDSSRYLLGAILVIIGAFLLSKRLFPWFFTRFFWPILLIAAGLIIIFKGWRK